MEGNMIKTDRRRVSRGKAMNMRTTDDVRARLEQAATESGRAIAHEVEHRVARTFAEDDLRRIVREEIKSCLREVLREHQTSVAPAPSAFLASVTGRPFRGH
jgi:hypothetical protein